MSAGQEVTAPVWRRVLDALGSGIARQAGDLLPPLVRAWTSQLEQVSAFLAEHERGVAEFYDLDASPFPGWLGQWEGVPYDRTATREEQVAAVRSRGSTRGTPRALRAAAAATMDTSTAAAVIELRERDGSAYRVSVRTYAVQTPDPAATLAALLAVKPVGLVLSLTVLAGRTFHDAVSYGRSFGMLRASQATFGDYLRTLPDHSDERTFAAAAGATFADTSRNTTARLLHPGTGRDTPATVQTFGRLATRDYRALRTLTYQALPIEGN